MDNLRKLKKDKVINRMRQLENAIKQNCYGCMNGQKKVDCQLRRCPLYGFRPWAINSDRGKD